MEREEYLKVLETTLLLLDGVSEAKIMLEYGLGPYLKKAKEVLSLLKS